MKRSIALLSINDAHVVELTDGGVDRNGAPTSQRQNLQRALTKKIDVDGRQVPAFRLASLKAVGPWRLTSGEVMPSSDEFIDFDDRYLRTASLEDMSEEMAKAWTTMRAARIEKTAERRRQAEAEIERARSGDVANAITSMVRSLEQNRPKAGAR